MYCYSPAFISLVVSTIVDTTTVVSTIVVSTIVVSKIAVSTIVVSTIVVSTIVVSTIIKIRAFSYILVFIYFYFPHDWTRADWIVWGLDLRNLIIIRRVEKIKVKDCWRKFTVWIIPNLWVWSKCWKQVCLFLHNFTSSPIIWCWSQQTPQTTLSNFIIICNRSLALGWQWLVRPLSAFTLEFWCCLYF